MSEAAQDDNAQNVARDVAIKTVASFLRNQQSEAQMRAFERANAGNANARPPDSAFQRDEAAHLCEQVAAILRAGVPPLNGAQLADDVALWLTTSEANILFNLNGGDDVLSTHRETQEAVVAVTAVVRALTAGTMDKPRVRHAVANAIANMNAWRWCYMCQDKPANTAFAPYGGESRNF